jgi:hypothetical protein
MPKFDLPLWIARLLIAIVTCWNLECALVFLTHPGVYAGAFELVGFPGQAAIQGMAILFIMWNIPYLVALWHPQHHKVSLWEAIAMQTTGVLGESYIFISVSTSFTLLHASLARFVLFDAVGILLLIGALLVTPRQIHEGNSNEKINHPIHPR